MAHHGNRPFGDMPEEFRKLLEGDSLREFRKNMTGPTGRFPEGKLTDQDEGEVAFVVGNRDGKVVLEFAGPVHWIGMTGEQAQDLAELLLSKAAKIGTLRPVRVRFD